MPVVALEPQVLEVPVDGAAGMVPGAQEWRLHQTRDLGAQPVGAHDQRALHLAHRAIVGAQSSAEHASLRRSQ